MPETVRGLLAEAKRLLKDVEDAALDSRLLLQHAAKISHEEIVADPGHVVAEDAAQAFRNFVQRRKNNEPVSRIIGEREFYGRVFAISPAVLDPRPDTETLIDLALEYLKGRTAPRILDLGTGSGILAVTLLAELPNASAVATDISRAPLTSVRGNADRLGVGNRLETLQANWLDGVTGDYDLIVSNPPYIPLADIPGLAPDVKDYDPAKALDGGPDGLEAYRRIAVGAPAHLAPRGAILVESGAGQQPSIKAIFAAQELEFRQSKADLGGHERALLFIRRP
ncbi:MAG: peptide chain release factor N(5)-glutamine methyltransferase [Rhizobiales bacterium]|nr:peptide chain release factor N(5)-glutamine methyltransferase [Hyphomicrobiales bacterium]